MGLTAFGVAMVREMNRLGMVVDLAHVSPGAFSHALEVVEKPVLFSPWQRARPVRPLSQSDGRPASGPARQRRRHRAELCSGFCRRHAPPPWSACSTTWTHRGGGGDRNGGVVSDSTAAARCCVTPPRRGRSWRLLDRGYGERMCALCWVATCCACCRRRWARARARHLRPWAANVARWAARILYRPEHLVALLSATGCVEWRRSMACFHPVKKGARDGRDTSYDNA